MNEEKDETIDVEQWLDDAKKINIIVREVNEPNFDLMAVAFYDLIKKR